MLFIYFSRDSFISKDIWHGFQWCPHDIHTVSTLLESVPVYSHYIYVFYYKYNSVVYIYIYIYKQETKALFLSVFLALTCFFFYKQHITVPYLFSHQKTVLIPSPCNVSIWVPDHSCTTLLVDLVLLSIFTNFPMCIVWLAVSFLLQ
jgi:hypothetical protein